MPIDDSSPKQNRRLRLGMVGGGPGAFIGAVHRIAARLDDRYDRDERANKYLFG